MASICSGVAFRPPRISAGSPPKYLKRKKTSRTTPSRSGSSATGAVSGRRPCRVNSGRARVVGWGPQSRMRRAVGCGARPSMCRESTGAPCRGMLRDCPGTRPPGRLALSRTPPCAERRPCDRSAPAAGAVRGAWRFALRRAARTRRRCCAMRSRSPRPASTRRRSPTSTRARIAANIFEAPLTLRLPGAPGQLRPSTATALPEVSADFSDLHVPRAARHLLRRRPGLQGQEARADGGGLRLLDQAPLRPALKSPTYTCSKTTASSAWTSCARRRCATRQPFDYDTPVEGLRALDRYTFAVQARASRSRASPTSSPTRRAPARSRARSSRPTATRSWSTRSAPGRSGSPSGGAARGSCSSATPTTATSSTTPSRRPTTPRARPLASALARAGALPMVDRVEVSDHRGAAAALARVPERRDRTVIERVPNDFAHIAIPNSKLAPNLAKQRHHDAPRTCAPTSTHVVLQHGGPGRRRLHAREGRAAPGDRARLRRRGARSASCGAARRSRRSRHRAAGPYGYDPTLRAR